MADLDVRVLRSEVLDDRPPEPRRREHVGLVDARQALTPSPGELECHLDDPSDLRLRVRQRVAGDARPRLAGRLRPASEIEPARQLADDQQVDALEEVGTERRRRHERRVDGHRPEVREQPEAAAQREE
jgi:hypothetical protein